MFTSILAALSTLADQRASQCLFPLAVLVRESAPRKQFLGRTVVQLRKGVQGAQRSFRPGHQALVAQIEATRSWTLRELAANVARCLGIAAGCREQFRRAAAI